MTDIAKKSVPIQLIVYYPQTEQGKHELAKRVAAVHADMVSQYIQQLNCPSAQKLQLMEAIIQAVSNKKRAGVQTE